jgi:[protein-PII] uridylyltransferase
MATATNDMPACRGSGSPESHGSDSGAPLSAGTAQSRPGWQWHRDRLHRMLAQQPIAGIPTEEIDAHFDDMPHHYWERVTPDELVWGLQTVHRFYGRLATADAGEGVAITDARHFPSQGCTKVIVCTWDRMGLLTRLAGYISALRLNVIRAEVYTRADNVVLDVFWLCNDAREHISDTERLTQLSFLLEGGLSEPPRFASTWACNSHKLLPYTNRPKPLILFNNDDSPVHTIVTVQASERLGLLHDMLEVFNEHRLNVTEALIDTIDDVAHDIFFVTDEDKQKVLNSEKLDQVERALVKALG